MTQERAFDCPNCGAVVKVRLRRWEAPMQPPTNAWDRTVLCGCGEELQVMFEEAV